MRLSDVFTIAMFVGMCIVSHIVYLAVYDPNVDITNKYYVCYAAGIMLGVSFTSGLMWARERWLIPHAIKHGYYWACNGFEPPKDNETDN